MMYGFCLQPESEKKEGLLRENYDVPVEGFLRENYDVLFRELLKKGKKMM